MTPFIVCAVLILVAALYLLSRPLRNTRNTLSYERHAQNIHFAKERLQELEEQLKSASITATDYEALKLEIESTLAHDIDLATLNDNQQALLPRRSNKALILALCVSLPLATIGLYWAIGTPSALYAINNADQSGQPTQATSQDIQSLLNNVEQRLAANPNDAEGWAILARTYLALGRYSEARNGFLTLLKLEGESADIYASLADATGLMAGGNMSGEPISYVERALALQPKHPQALWLAGRHSNNKARKLAVTGINYYHYWPTHRNSRPN